MSRWRVPSGRQLLLSLLALAASGCVERFLRIESDPVGAQVVVSGIGRAGRVQAVTPVEIPFTHYGTVRIDAWFDESPGTTTYVELARPWYQFFPLDLFAEFLDPRTHVDRHEVKLAPPAVATPADASRDAVLKRADELRTETR